jgi:predicted GH43/DUF377 family glycosyl hydrolase
MENKNKKVKFKNNSYYEIDCNNPLIRYPGNPIILPEMVNCVWKNPALKVITVHNAGVTEYNNETLLLFRSHLRCGCSILGIARSPDGITNWRVDPQPALLPATSNDIFEKGVNIQDQIETESGGIEDPRITKIEDNYIITYSAYHAKIKNRVRVCIASTTDFITFTRYGPMFKDNMRNVVFFPEKIDNKYFVLLRPNDTTFGDLGGMYTQIRIGISKDWKNGEWKISETPVMQTGAGPSSFSDKIGPGAPPIKTSYGWLSIFHGVRKTMAGNPYVLGVALHNYYDPSDVLMSSIPVLFPTYADCRIKEDDYIHVPQVVFTCGAFKKSDGTIMIYYGGNDTVLNLALSHEDVLVDLCKNYNQDPVNGSLLYGVIY